MGAKTRYDEGNCQNPGKIGEAESGLSQTRTEIILLITPAKVFYITFPQKLMCNLLNISIVNTLPVMLNQ